MRRLKTFQTRVPKQKLGRFYNQVLERECKEEVKEAHTTLLDQTTDLQQRIWRANQYMLDLTKLLSDNRETLVLQDENGKPRLIYGIQITHRSQLVQF